MFRIYASNSHSYTHLIPALGIVREPTVWVFITSNYPGIHDIGLGGYCTAGPLASHEGSNPWRILRSFFRRDQVDVKGLRAEKQGYADPGIRNLTYTALALVLGFC